MGTVNSANPGVIVAADGGGSKTDVVAVDLDGRVLAHSRGPASNPQTQGLETAVSIVDTLVTEVLHAVDLPLARVGLFLSGLDLPVEIATFREGISHLDWVSDDIILDNDMFALLRTGTQQADAVAVVCGTGINCIGVRADGETARFPAVGAISGDWGGGWQLGEQALWHAARAVDGRGAPTVFSRVVPEHFGLPDVQAVVEAFHFGRLPYSALSALSPAVIHAAEAGDAVAGGILNRQAEEIVALAGAAIRRLDLVATPIPVVLGGGVLAADSRYLLGLIESGLAAIAPQAMISVVRERPIVGAALLTLEAAGVSAEHERDARAALVETVGRMDRVRT